ncbi:hypothetical protein ACIPSA_28100 [Streptomyces sp. NPDC086549]|uniref:hypothetical protein n=1 Tax=Streptomyces sp. NPDC086549 TaxID=3365752 RepID=UPI00381B4A19
MNRASCRARDTEYIPDAPTPCLLLAAHPARHTFEYGTAVIRKGLLHRALTVSDLRKAMEHLGDSAPMRPDRSAVEGDRP